MRIVISGMFWAEPNVGSGRYLHELATTLAQIQTPHQFALVVPHYTRATPPNLEGWQVLTKSTPFDGRSRNLAKLWFEQITFPQTCRQLRADLVHVPYFAAPLRSTCPLVVTIHDLIPLLLPEYHGSRAVQIYMRLAAIGARRATAVIADSDHTRLDVIAHLGIPPERIAITHLAAAPEYIPQTPEVIDEVCARLRIQRPYVYYIGGFDVRKNVQMVIHAYAAATKNIPNPPQLVIGGRVPQGDNPLHTDVHRLINEAGITNQVTLPGWVTDADNAALMAGCAAFLFPSHYEGFGLDPLEAMQCGAPVLASKTTSVGEVVGDGGVLLDPDDLDGWAAALRRVLTDPNFAADLRRRGLERARQFSWTKTTAQTLTVYESVLKGQSLAPDP